MLARDVPQPEQRAREPSEEGAGESVSDEFARKIGITPAELQSLVRDLGRRRAAVYWSDMLLACSVAYASFWCANQSWSSGMLEALWLAVSACAVYRGTLFTHELAHAGGRDLRTFRVVWNLLCGIPILVPSFLYEIHSLHHDRRTYASIADGEYRAFASLPRVEAFASVAVALLAVPVLVLRFLVLAPLGWLVPPLRRLLLAKASALVIDFRSPRELPARIPLRWTAQEAACFVWCAALFALAVQGPLSPAVLARGYVVVTGAVFLNALRVLCAHRYRGQDAPMSFVEQVLDSNNFPNGFAWLWAPLGLRYHATHHLLPSLPYHALGEASRRLMRELPGHSAFRQTSRRSFWAGLEDVLRRRDTRARDTRDRGAC